MPILGYFVYTDLGDGVLASKYGHTRGTILFSECATRVADDQQEPAHRFLGTYSVTWIDTVNPASNMLSRLVIARKPNTTGQYLLTWMHPTNHGTIFYHGEGMMYENTLVGAYWNQTVENSIPQLRNII